MSDYYAKDGSSIEMLEWGKLFSDWDYKRIAKTTINGAEVSTVWLGMNHSFGEGPPLIFETMIFGDNPLGDEYCDRYATEAEAQKGHDDIVARLTDV